MTMPNMLVIGNCQAEGVAKCMAFLLEGATCGHVPMWDLKDYLEKSKAGLDTLKKYDFVFCQPDVWGHISFAEIADLLPDVVRWPNLVFNAFHPDIVSIFDADNEYHQFPSPLNHYHSAIGLYAFLQGLDCERTATLFNATTFAKAGYYDFWDDSVAYLRKELETYGYEFENTFAKWCRRGSFMYSVNHPKLFTLADIAAATLRRIGFSQLREGVDDYIQDDLRYGAIWPLYPALAEHFSLPGTMVFKRPTYPIQPGSDLLTLSQFLSESFKMYSAIPRARLKCDRVIQWQTEGLRLD
jgi:Polysaccharide biosynthesis enzyme WcbI